MEKTKVALLGRRGHWGYALKGLKDLADVVEVVGISTGCEDDPAAMAEIVKDFLGIEPKIYEDYKVFIINSNIDSCCRLHQGRRWQGCQCLRESVRNFCAVHSEQSDN